MPASETDTMPFGNSLEVDTGYMIEELRLPGMQGFHQIKLRVDAADASVGQIVMNPNTCTLDAFGNPTICTLMADVVLPAALSLIDQSAGNKLFSVDSPGYGILPLHLALIPRRDAQDGYVARLLHIGSAGGIERIVNLMPAR